MRLFEKKHFFLNVETISRFTNVLAKELVQYNI